MLGIFTDYRPNQQKQLSLCSVNTVTGEMLTTGVTEESVLQGRDAVSVDLLTPCEEGNTLLRDVRISSQKNGFPRHGLFPVREPMILNVIYKNLNF
jgi:hypothetical protein